MILSHCNQSLKLVDAKTGEHLCEKCGTTFFIREQKPEKKPNVELQEFEYRTIIIVVILVVVASCNWFLSILENVKW